MTSTIRYFSIALLASGILAACGGSESDQQPTQQQTQQQQQQAQQDSMAQAKADSIARAKADSVAQAKEQRKQQKEKEQKAKEKLTLEDISFNKNGPFSVQVGAWRSRDKAEEIISTWKQRGFENAYMVKYGDEDTGDIWFRVRVGKVGSKAMAEKLSKLLKEKYDEESWTSTTQSESS